MLQRLAGIALANLILMVGFVQPSRIQAEGSIGALGKIVPVGGILNLAGLSGATIEKILVKQDQEVALGDPLVTFAGKSLHELEVALMRSHLQEAEASGEMAIQIQQQTLAKLEETASREIELQKIKIAAASETASYTSRVLRRLIKSGAESFSANLRSENEHLAENARIGLDIARSELSRLTGQRESEMRLAKLELERLKQQKATAVEQAKLKLEQAEATLRQATLVAPVAGTILEILNREGERATSAIIRMADLRRMAVHADIFQADVLNVKPGMTAKITSKSLPLAMKGIVASEGRIISDNTRVATTVIHLTDPGPAAELINLEVEVSLSSDP